MKEYLPIGLLIAVVFTVFISIPFSPGHAQSQAARAATIKVSPTGSIRPVDPAPVPIDTLRTVAAPLRTDNVQPIAPVSIRAVVVPQQPPTPDRESSDCTVHEFVCAETCYPLPNGWQSYRACLRAQCKQVEENCLERLARELDSRRTVSELTFLVQRQFPYKTQIEFYSQDRKVAWPGNGQAYNTDFIETHVFKLRCNFGETICYGAWVTQGTTKHWGVGLDDRHGCNNCCAKCGGKAVSYVLK